MAASPSSTGIRMSISVTSGCSRVTTSTASWPFAASPTTSRSGSDSSSDRKPARTMPWSSQMTMRVISRSLSGRRGGQPGAAAGGGLEPHRAAVQRHPLADADQAVTAVRRFGRYAAAVVLDLDVEVRSGSSAA